jgi:hypothetical protein
MTIEVNMTMKVNSWLKDFSSQRKALISDEVNQVGRIPQGGA